MNQAIDEKKYIRFREPQRTKNPCPNPEFADHNLHRVGVYKGDYESEGLTGWHLKSECVNCKKQFKYPYFFPIGFDRR